MTVSSLPPLVPAAPMLEPPDLDGPRRRRRRQTLAFGAVAAVVLAAGLVVVLVMVLSGGDSPLRRRASAPTDVRPPLAQMCPAPTVPPNFAPTVPPNFAPTVPPNPAPPPGGVPKSGARTVDKQAGISYAAFGPPWQPWTTVWRAGSLQVPYGTGQHFVTERYSGGSYHASILSAAVPAADNDALIVDLECVGRQIAADVRAEYYPQPNTMKPIKDVLTSLGGRPAWLSVFRLSFASAGLRATDELSAVAVIDVGKPTAAVLYVSIPGTHRQFESVIDAVLASVRRL